MPVAFEIDAAEEPDTVGGKNFRTSLEQRKTSRATNVRKQSLFGMVDVDKSGYIDEAEFGELYEVVKQAAEADAVAKVLSEKKAVNAKRKVKLLACFGMVMAVFLGLSVAANFAVTYVLLDATKETEAKEGVLKVKGTDQAVAVASTDFVNENGNLVDPMTHASVKVASSHEQLKLDSRLDDAVLAELQQIYFKNSEGGSLTLHVQAFSRTVAIEDSPCEEPLFGSYVRIHTAVGAIWLDGDIMTYEDGMSGVFAGAGFKVAEQGHRRLQGAFDLMGIFNSIPSFVGWNSTYDGLPRFPTSFTADISIYSACPPVDDPTIAQQPVCTDAFSTERAEIIRGHKFIETKLNLMVDGSKGLVRERTTALPGLDGWAYEVFNDQTNMYKSQVWTETGERYFCRSISSASSTSSFALPVGDAAQHLLAVFVGEKMVGEESRLAFRVKSREAQGMVFDYEVVRGASAPADGVLEVHPRWMMLTFDAHKGKTCQDDSVKGVGFRFNSFVPAESSTLDLGWTPASAGSPFSCSDTQTLTDVTKDSGMIISTSPFQLYFGTGVTFSNLALAMTIQMSRNASTRAADVIEEFHFGRRDDKEYGGMPLAAMLYRVTIDEFQLTRFAEQYDPNTGSADFAHVTFTRTGMNATVHEPAAWAIKQHEWATKLAYQHGLGYLKELLVWRLHDVCIVPHCEKHWLPLMAGSLVWNKEKEEIAVLTAQVQPTWLPSTFDMPTNFSTPPPARRKLSPSNRRELIGGCDDKSWLEFTPSTPGPISKVLGFVKEALPCTGHIGFPSACQVKLSCTSPKKEKKVGPIEVEQTTSGSLEFGWSDDFSQFAAQGCISNTYAFKVNGWDVGVAGSLCVEEGKTYCAGAYRGYLKGTGSLTGTVGSCPYGCAEGNLVLSVKKFLDGACWEDQDAISVDRLAVRACGSGFCADVFATSFDLVEHTYGNTYSCDSSCDRASACDSSCDSSCDGSCDHSCDHSCDDWSGLFSCDSSCDSECDTCDSSCDSECDTNYSCDDSCDSSGRRMDAMDVYEVPPSMSGDWTTRLAHLAETTQKTAP